MQTYIDRFMLLWILVAAAQLVNFVPKIFKVIIHTKWLELSLYDGVFSYSHLAIILIL